VSRDGQRVALAEADDRNAPIWLLALDRRSPPVRIPDIEGQRPFFGADGDIFISVLDPDGQYRSVHRVRADGSGRQQVVPSPVIGLRSITPDDKWLIVRARANQTSAMWAFPVGDGTPQRLAHSDANDFQWSWSSDGSRVIISGPSPFVALGTGRSYVIPLEPGQIFPPMPEGGFGTEDQIAKVPGARRIDSDDVAAGPSNTYAVAKVSAQRNLYRIPVPR
jgi:hypothetical protein